MKRSFFQAAVTSILLYGCTTWTLTKRLEKKLDGNYTRMLRAILNKSWQQHPTRHQLYGHLPPITKTIQVRRTRHAGHCCSRVKWSNPGNGVAPSPTPWCSSYRKGSLRVTLDYIYIYIYIYTRVILCPRRLSVWPPWLTSSLEYLFYRRVCMCLLRGLSFRLRLVIINSNLIHL